MAKKKTFKNPEELQKAWKARMAKIDASMPKTFKQFCAQCLQVSVMYMNQLVYNAAQANTRSGQMKRCEFLIRRSAIEYVLINTAKTADDRNYAYWVHNGRDAMDAPTPTGKLAFAWLKNRAARRPASDDAKEWRRLRKSGKAVVTPHIKATKPKPWRDKMVEHMRGKFAKLYHNQITEIFTR